MDIFNLLQEASKPAPAVQQEALQQKIATYLNHLLLHDFAALVQLLYRIDVPEQHVKRTLQANPNEDAGKLLAILLLQRIQEKEALRRKYKAPPSNASDEERW